MLHRLTISFTPEEREALQRMATEDCRPPKDEVRWLVRKEDLHRRLLSEGVRDPDQREAGSDTAV